MSSIFTLKYDFCGLFNCWSKTFNFLHYMYIVQSENKKNAPPSKITGYAPNYRSRSGMGKPDACVICIQRLANPNKL